MHGRSEGFANVFACQMQLRRVKAVRFTLNPQPLTKNAKPSSGLEECLGCEVGCLGAEEVKGDFACSRVCDSEANLALRTLGNTK